MKPTKPKHREDKGWGYEIWIHHAPGYCGKILLLERGKKCSLHHHERKRETIYIQSGRLRMRTVDKVGLESVFEMKKGDVLNIYPGLKHQFTGIAEATEILEFSTRYLKSDSILTEEGD